MPKLNSFLGPVTSPTESVIRAQPILFTLIVLYQGLFSGNAITIPKNLKTLFNSKVFRFISLMMIAFSATQDIEYAIIATTIFISLMYAIKTPEERKETGLI
jgi:hypothetical protein